MQLKGTGQLRWEAKDKDDRLIALAEFFAKQQSIGGSLTLGAGVSGSLSASQSKIDSDYASVTQQSGIRAGDGGFNVQVKGNTDLKGGAITSTQAAIDQNKNRFETGTLSASDIQNKAEYKGSATGVNLGAGTSLDGKLAPSGTGAGIGSDKGSAESATLAAISGIAGNKDARTGDAESGIGKIFDADKVQKEINAQVKITQTFGQQASQAVEEYANTQMSRLRERYAQERDPEKRKALEAEVERLRFETHVLNVLIGAVTGQGASALTKESLAAAAEEMRRLMIEDSKKFAGITDGETTLTNTSGASVGGKWDLDPTKTGGTRVDLDSLCGPGYGRCVVQKDANDDPIRDEKGIPKLALNDKGQVQFDPKAANMSLAKFIEETEQGKKMAGLTGGIQGWKGTLFGVPYRAGSWQDKLIEAFGGTHDMIGGKLPGLYDGEGNIKRGMSGAERKAYDVWSSIAVMPSAPFAMADLLPAEVWKGISLFLEAAR